MNGEERALLIILSAALAVFLLLSIIALVKIIQILNHIKRIIERAESIADKAEAVGEFFQKTAGPAAIAKLVGNIVHSFRQRKEGKEE